MTTPTHEAHSTSGSLGFLLHALFGLLVFAYVCSSPAHAATLVNEGFESGLGIFSQSTADNIDWTRDSAGTPSSSTGPSSGSNGSTYYMYTEASSYTNKIALLKSSAISLAGYSSSTLSFDYHMYGADMGTLEVQLSNNGSSFTTIWSKSGNQNDSWYTQSIDLSSYLGGNLYIQFKGTTGSNYRSDMAIDNIIVNATATVSTQDFGDAPDASTGTASGNYQTRTADNGPRHTIIPNLMIGAQVDADSGSLQNTNADADDTNGTDDEDGLINAPIIPTTAGQNYTLPIYVKNDTNEVAYLTAYIDFNRDGDFLDTGEKADTQFVYGSGYFYPTFTLPSGLTAGTTYARLRLSQTKAEAETPVGAATSGEVEDHKLTISSGPYYDFGDAPASYGDARHTINNSIRLGDNPADAEATSYYSYNASGDNYDEDGAPHQSQNPRIALFPILKMTATSYSVDIKATNTTGSVAKLYGWIDFDHNGSFQADEAASISVPNNTNGNVTLTWNSIPTDIKLGTTFIRLRLTTDASVTTSTPSGNASNGEVEDYPIAVAMDIPPDSPNVTIVRGEAPACSTTVFTDDFNDLTVEQYFGANTSATPTTIRNWTVSGGGNDTYAHTLSTMFSAQGTSIYFGNGFMRRIYPDVGVSPAFDGNGKALSPPDAIELRDDLDDTTPGVHSGEADWGPEPVKLSRTFTTVAGQKYHLYFVAIPEDAGSDYYGPGIMRVDTPSGSIHFKAPGGTEGIQRYRIEFTATGSSSTISFVNYGHIGTDGGWCDPNSVISGAWCTVGGAPISKNGNELIIDDVTVAQASACKTSTISGSVYVDQNGNNTFDTASESGLGNITVTLYDNNGTTNTTADDAVVASTSTAANGSYSFTGISSTLHYRIEVDEHDSDLPNSAAVGTTNPLADVTVASGATLANQNFGFDLACNASAGQFGGIVFRDYNQNGIRDLLEEGIAGVTVKAYDSANAVVATATTNASGWYSLSGLSNGAQYRLEYTDLPAGLAPGSHGTDNASNTRFITANGSCNTHYGVSDPVEYCQADPYVAANAFVNGTPTAAYVGDYASIHTFPYSATGPIDAATPPASTKAKTAQTGALWGMAYQKSTKTLYASAVMRRFSGLGSLGAGGIYKVNMSDPTANTGASAYIDVRTIGIPTGSDARNSADSCNSLSTDPWLPSHDVAAWDMVGKIGIGDIDYDDANNRLWLVNLNDRKLYGIGNINPATAPTASDVLGGYAISLPSPYSCSSGTLRPWAVKYHRGYVYVGGVCDAASDPYTPSKVRGYVLKLDPNNASAGFSYVKDFAIDQTRYSYAYSTAQWNGWISQTDAQSWIYYHSPIVGNLEFDTDGSIIVGIIDRAGMQNGNVSYDEPSCADTSTDYTEALGDVLRLCKTDSGYLTDGEPGCSTTIPLNSKTSNEYYWGDSGPYTDAWASMNEVASGGLAMIPGREHVLMSGYDVNSWGANGITWLNNTTGAPDNRYSVSWTTYSKSTGMGELEVLCDTAPIEIGNRVWLDTDSDGIQDANESGISNVSVKLTCGSDSTTVTTNTAGEYYFSNATGGNAAFMDAGESCSLSIDSSQTTLDDYSLATQNADGQIDNNANNDIRDSDAADNAGTAKIDFTVGSHGHNNHSLDFGYQPTSGAGGGTIVATATCNATEVSVNISGLNAGGSVQISLAQGAAGTQGWIKTADTSGAVTFKTPRTSNSSYTALVRASAEDKTAEASADCPAIASNGNITGVAFRDFNANGVLDTGATFNEVGVAGITVKAFDADDPANTPTATATTDVSGNYSLTGLTDGVAYRIEFGNLPAGNYSTRAPSSSMQFHASPASEVNFGIVSPQNYYSGSNSEVLTSIITNGDQSTGTERTLVSIPYNASAPWQGDVSTQAVDTSTGSVYGIAYQPQTDRIFTSAYLKRHTGLGPAGLDAIYVTKRGSNSPSVFVELKDDLGIDVGTIGSNASRGLGDKNAPSHDADAFNLTGTVGIGDIDISADGETLYVTNLYDKTLYAIKIDADNNPATRPTPADVTAYPIPVPALCNISTAYTNMLINMGGERYEAADAEIWMRSSFHLDGQYGSVSNAVDVSASGAAEESIYQTFMDYVSKIEVPLPNGTYTIRMHYADFWGSPTGRNFDINFENGQLIDPAFNIYNAAGGNGKAVVKSYDVTVNDGMLNIDFTANKQSVLISGMEIIGHTKVPAGNWRPFAIGVEGESVFVGGVCDAATSQNPMYLRATVYQLNNNTGTFQQALSTSLDYNRGVGYSTCDGQHGWFGWLPANSYPSNCDYSGNIAVYPQPILSDIEFAADRSMLLGFRDRFGDQVGQDNYRLSGTTTMTGSASGDVLRADWSGGSYHLEKNASVAGLISAGAGNMQGPRGGEFYYQDNFGDGHAETSMGGLASHKGFNQLLYSRINPEDTVRTAGIGWLNNNTGEQERGYMLYNQSAHFLGKAAGLGDVEIVLEPAPIEIGDRVWLDSDSDGIQDADESGISNVNVKLTCGSDSATATTNTNGEYYFSGASDGNATFMKHGENCSLSISNTQAGLSSYILTSQNADGQTDNNSQTDIRDSDATLSGSNAVINFTIGGSGNNNYSLDFGYKPNSTIGSGSCGPVITSIMPSGALSNAGNAGRASVIAFDYSTRGTAATTPDPVELASAREVGTVWGKAYDGLHKKLYVSSFLRRHADLSPDGLGAIYTIDVSDVSSNATVGAPSLWMNLNSAAALGSSATLFPSETAANRELGSPFSPSHDVWAYNRVGKDGIGGIDLSDDFTTLYAVDMTNRQLLAVNTSTKTVTGRYPITNPGCAGGAGDVRPFGVDYLKGNVYVGVTCSGETRSNSDDVNAYVMKLSGNTFTPVLSGAKGLQWTSYWGNNPYGPGGTCSSPSVNTYVPVITNMQLDENDNMLVGVTGINGFRFGSNNYAANASCSNTVGLHETYGLLLRATPSGSTWTLPATEKFDNSGNTFQHFYKDGQYAHWGPGASHSYLGGLAVTDCSGQEVAIANIMDPLDFESAGTRYMRTADGQHETAAFAGDTALATSTASTLEHYQGVGSSWEKSSGMGDIEYLNTDSVTVNTGSIMGTVYTDTNGNNTYDVGTETGIGAITVTLKNAANGSIIATSSTIGGGLYSFTGLDSSLTYQIEVDGADVDLSGKTIGTTNPLTGVTVAAGGTTADKNFGFDDPVTSCSLIVTVTADTDNASNNSGSLRDAIQCANASAGTNTITFNIPTSQPGYTNPDGIANSGDEYWKLQLSSQLPSITEDLTINGRSQATNKGNTNSGNVAAATTVGVDGLTLQAVASPEIVLVGNTGINGFDIRANNVRLYGMGMYTFNTSIRMDQSNINGIVIDGMVLGANPVNGGDIWPTIRTNQHIAVDGSNVSFVLTNSLLAYTEINRGIVTGQNTTVSNVSATISGNHFVGMGKSKTTDNGAIEFLRTQSPSVSVIGNRFEGIGAGNASDLAVEFNDYGGGNVTCVTCVVQSNDISGFHDGVGYFTDASITGLQITKNRIHDVTEYGVFLGNAHDSIVTQNALYNNGKSGVLINKNAAINNTISKNSIYNNGQVGINLAGTTDLAGAGITLNDANDADSGPNNLLNYPLFSRVGISGSNLVVQGCAPSGSSIELFEADVSPGGAATVGANRFTMSTDYGEGQTYLTTLVEGSASDTATGNCTLPIDVDGNNSTGMKAFSFTIAKPASIVQNDLLTATATVSGVGTSEFSPILKTGDATLLLGNIQGVVYVDANGNNTYDAATETSLPGITVSLFAENGTSSDISDDTLVATTISAGSGGYIFTDISAAAGKSYRVQVDSNDTDLPANASLGTTNPLSGVTVTDGVTTTDKNFGFDLSASSCTAPAPSGSNSGLNAAISWTHNQDEPAGQAANHGFAYVNNTSLISSGSYELANNLGIGYDAWAMYVNRSDIPATLAEAISGNKYLQYSFSTQSPLSGESLLYGVRLAVVSTSFGAKHSGKYKLQMQVADNAAFSNPKVVKTLIQVDETNPTSGSNIVEYHSEWGEDYYLDHYDFNTPVTLSGGKNYYVRFYLYDDQLSGSIGGGNAVIFDDMQLKVHTCNQSGIRGTVYTDSNSNDAYDAATESGIGSVTVTLKNNASGVTISTTSTAADGSYRFSGLDPALTYRIDVDTADTDLPSDYTIGTINPLTGITVTAGSTKTDQNFGFENTAPLCAAPVLASDTIRSDAAIAWTHNLDNPAGASSNHALPSIYNTGLITSAANEAIGGFTTSNTGRGNDIFYMTSTAVPAAQSDSNYVQYSFTTQSTLTEDNYLYGIGMATYQYDPARWNYSGSYKVQVKIADNAAFTSPITLQATPIQIDQNNPATGASVSDLDGSQYYFNHYNFEKVLTLHSNTTYYVRVYPYNVTSDGKVNGVTGRVALDDVHLKTYSCGTGSISGKVYADDNRNDSYDSATESGISSIKVTLKNNATGAVLATTNTVVGGSYSFTGLSASLTYRIEVDTADTDLPAGSSIGTTNPLTGVTVTAGSITSNKNFGFDIDLGKNLSGKVFEDVNYGGGAGRTFGTAGTATVAGARVELYGTGGTFISSATTAADGSYTFSSLLPGNYYVRIANATVKSTRIGSNGSERGVQTYRTNGTTAVADEVGGRKPSVADAGSNTTSQTLNTSTFVLSGGGQAQSVQPVAMTSSDVTGVSFGFNFDTIVNARDNGQGSLRQFIINTNLLGGDTSLAQAGRTAGKENAILELSTSDPKFNAANQYWSIAVETPLPDIGDNVILDGSTQAAQAGFAFANRPVIELDGTIVKSLGQWTNGLILAGTNGGSTVKYFAINRFDDAGIKIRSSKNNTVSFNYIGTDPVHSASNIGNGVHGIEIVNPTDFNLVSDNLIAYNKGHGILAWNFNGGGTEKAASISHNSIYANGGLGINLAAGDPNDEITINDTNDADSGANGLLNMPILQQLVISNGTATVRGCAPAGAIIEFFEADVSPGGAASVGANRFGLSVDYGEGQTYLGSLAEGGAADMDAGNCAIPAFDGHDNTGMKAFQFSVPAPASLVEGDYMTATATLAASGTSEFGPAVKAIGGPPPVGSGSCAATGGSDILFIVDNSGSIDAGEFTDFANTIQNVGTQLLADNPANRVAVAHFGGPYESIVSGGQHVYIERDFSNAPVSAPVRQFGWSGAYNVDWLADHLSGAVQQIRYALDGDASTTSSYIISPLKETSHNTAAPLQIVLMTDALRYAPGGAFSVLIDPAGSGAEPDDGSNFTIYNQLKAEGVSFSVVSFNPVSEDIATSAAIASVGGTYTGIIEANPKDPQGSQTTPRRFISVTSGFKLTTAQIEELVEATAICSSTISGTVFEDVNYGGNVVSAFGDAGTVGVAGATVEVYDNTGAYVASTSTGSDGSYKLPNLPDADYFVRVVSDTVNSSRSGSNGSEVPVPTYRSNGVTAVTNEIGGRKPSAADAGSNAGSSTLNTTTFVFSGGTLAGKQAQAIQLISLTGSSIKNADFGFNFDTIVNTNDAGQGSLRQFLANANLLGGDASLAQEGRTAGAENAIFMLPINDPRYNSSGNYWNIALQSQLPNITNQLILDGSTQSGFVSSPVLYLDGTSAGAANGLTFGAGSNNSQVKSFAIKQFGGAGILINGATNTLIGGTSSNTGNIVTGNSGDGVAITGNTSQNNAILGNAIYSNGGLGIDLANDGITPNDVGDADSGPNNLLNYPDAQANAFSSNGTKIVTYDLDLDMPVGNYRLEFFVSSAKDPSGNGEGQTYIGSKDIVHNGLGSKNYKGTFNANQTVASGVFISSTITFKSGANSFGPTSEFSGIKDGIPASVCTDLVNGVDENMVIDENSSTITLLEARDAGGNPITYVISGGTDSSLFTIVGPTSDSTLDCSTVKFLNTSVVVTKSAKADADTRASMPPGFLPPPGDYEIPQDANGDNVYDFQITAIYANGKKYVKDMSVQVANVNEAPFITSAAAISYDEDSTTKVIDIASQDPDIGTSEGNGLTYSITGGADAAYFTVAPATGIVKFRAIPDYDAPMDSDRNNVYELEVTVTDSGGLSGSKAFTITIVNNTADDGVLLQARAFLQGPYNAANSLMNADLHTLGMLPTTQPYTIAPFNYNGTETLSSMQQEATGSNVMVDWALVELRSSLTNIVARRAVILQRDGDLVDAQTGSADLHFASVKPGNYYVSVRHRNHLDIISASPVALSTTPAMLDFSKTATAVRGSHSRLESGSAALMWAGDINGSQTLTASGPNNDVTAMLSSILTATNNMQTYTNFIQSGYLATDINLDGKALFTGPGNDSNLLVGNILLHPLNTEFAGNYIVRGSFNQ